uniref:Uncharacterized protein n=1 Tax=Rhodnius prolixus TaxID=13249 RepID=T1I6D5_RHOPR
MARDMAVFTQIFSFQIIVISRNNPAFDLQRVCQNELTTSAADDASAWKIAPLATAELITPSLRTSVLSLSSCLGLTSSSSTPSFTLTASTLSLQSCLHD